MSASVVNRSLITLACLCLGLAGCFMVGPDYVPPAPELPRGWSQLDATAHPVMHPTSPESLSHWWVGLSDVLLSEVVDEALQANLDLQLAQARLREARARRAVASSWLLPTVTGTGTGSRSRSSEALGSGDTRNFFSVGFDAAWELDVFGGIRRGIEAAQADFESSKASLDNTQVSLVAEVALNYVGVRVEQILLAIARDNLGTQSETLQLTEWRAQAGLVSSQDVEQARTNREQTRAQIPALEITLAASEQNLDILIDKVPGTLHSRLAAPGTLSAVPEQIAVGIPADALRQRPDVRAAERNLGAETARVGVAEAARYPAFNLTGSIGLEALTVNALGNGGNTATLLLASITTPIFDAGRLRNEVEMQDAVREQALVTYEQTVLSALQEVENALVALARTRERSEALASAAESARIAALLARQRYSVGLIDFQPVLDTERSLLAVEESLATTRADNVLSLIRLYKALGGGWSPQTVP